MTVIVDASTVTAALIDHRPDGRWAEQLLDDDLAAPHLLPAEVTSVLRQAELAGDISADIASLAHADLADLRIELVSYEPVADRIWELRHNVTAYDAWYVAVAELIDSPLATLDRRLVGSPGPTCEFRTPSDQV